MIAVVSDTTCLTHLRQAGLLDVLPDVFAEILAPDAVAREYEQAHGALPPWVSVVPVTRYLPVTTSLDAGEAAAITLALERGLRLVIDERRGRRLAETLGLPVTGTLGVIELAYRLGFVADLADALSRLVDTGYRIAPSIIEEVIRRNTSPSR